MWSRRFRLRSSKPAALFNKFWCPPLPFVILFSTPIVFVTHRHEPGRRLSSLNALTYAAYSLVCYLICAIPPNSAMFLVVRAFNILQKNKIQLALQATFTVRSLKPSPQTVSSALCGSRESKPIRQEPSPVLSI